MAFLGEIYAPEEQPPKLSVEEYAERRAEAVSIHSPLQVQVTSANTKDYAYVCIKHPTQIVCCRTPLIHEWTPARIVVSRSNFLYTSAQT
jgi:hypothetical protein